MRTAALITVCLSIIGSARAGDMVDLTRKSIQIPPQELQVALKTFSEMEGVHLIFFWEDIKNRDTEGVSGSLTSSEALEQLLHGTALTYRFLEAHTAIIIPTSSVRGAPVETNTAGANAGKDSVASAGTGVRLPQVTVTTARSSDAQQLEYFRLLGALSREEYKRIVKTLPFEDSGTVKFPDAEGPGRRLLLGQHVQSAGVDGIELSRVFNFTWKRAESKLQVHNGNSFPVFVEIDYLKTALGDGAYVALAPGQTLALWSWEPTICRGVIIFGPFMPPEGCSDYSIHSGSAHVRTLKKWQPG